MQPGRDWARHLDGVNTLMDEQSGWGASGSRPISARPDSARQSHHSATQEKENPQVSLGVSMVGTTGIEPVTPSMSTRCSPAELRAL